MQLGDDSEAPWQEAQSDGRFIFLHVFDFTCLSLEIEEMERQFHMIYNAPSSDMPVQNPSSSNNIQRSFTTDLSKFFVH